MRSNREEADVEQGRNGPRPVGPAYSGPRLTPPLTEMSFGLFIAPRQEPHINSFVICRRGAAKLEGHHLIEEGHASFLGFP
jgi:hypothetical protein